MLGCGVLLSQELLLPFEAVEKMDDDVANPGQVLVERRRRRFLFHGTRYGLSQLLGYPCQVAMICYLVKNLQGAGTSAYLMGTPESSNACVTE